MKIIAISLLILLSSNSTADDEWVFFPGKSFGKITSSSTFGSIINSYGQENVIESEIHIGEGEYRKGYIIFPNCNTKKAEVLVNDKGQPSLVFINGDSTLWHSLEGITIGTSLQQLEEKNGKEFKLLGFGWDYSGSVVDWESGSLTKYKNLLIIRLSPKQSSYSEVLVGDKVLSSKQAEMNMLNPRVYQLGVQL